MDEKEFKALVEKVGIEAANMIKAEMKTAEDRLNGQVESMKKGLMTEEDFNKFKAEEVAKVNEKLTSLEKSMQEQGIEMKTIKENTKPVPLVSLDSYLQSKVDDIKAIQKAGAGVMEIDLKTAGITSIGNVIQPMTPPPNSPYLPGIGGTALELFEITRNPNFIMNYVDMGRTNQSRLAWVNETSTEGGAAAVQEGALKPGWNTRFKVEFSSAKKIAALSTITEEFEDDLPGFGTTIRRMLQDEVMRKFDDTLQAAIIAVAPGYTITGLNGKVDDSNMWDAMFAGLAQIGSKNYIANFMGVNPITSALAMMTKSAVEREYLMPPFLPLITSRLRESNKVSEGQLLVGDITQYKVDLYKDLVLKIGWINDDFGRNQFSVVAEIRYHDYISDNRKAALSYYNLNTVIALIDSGS